MQKGLRLLVLTALSGCFLQSGRSQIIFTDQKPYEEKAIIKMLYQEALILQDSMFELNFPIHTMEILETAQSKYLIMDGRMDLFQWINQKWINISKSRYHGYNFRSKKFMYQGLVYNFGGYGFWREHGDLIFFDPKSREWETKVISYHSDIGNNVSFLTDSILNIVNPISRNQHIDGNEKHEGLFQINLRTNQVQVKHLDPILKALKFATRIETENFYMPSFNPLQIIDKNHFTYKISELTYLKELYNYNHQDLYLIKGDSLILIHRNFEQPYASYDLSAIFNELPLDAKTMFQNSTNKLLLLTAICILTFLGGWLYRRKTMAARNPEFTHPVIVKLLAHSGSKLTQDELDQILEIETTISPDTLKSRRSNIFKEVNHEYKSKTGKELIIRTPDPLDKRKFLYQIS